jgi:hypothetical protein
MEINQTGDVARSPIHKYSGDGHLLVKIAVCRGQLNPPAMSALANIPAICCHLVEISTCWFPYPRASSVIQLTIQPTVDISFHQKKGFYSKIIKQRRELYRIHYLAIPPLSSNYIKKTDAVFNTTFCYIKKNFILPAYLLL